MFLFYIDPHYIHVYVLHRVAIYNIMSNGTEIDVVQELESFLYTPYGVSALAGLAILLTSALWGVCCCIYCCCCRRRCRGNQDGTLEANREIEYFGMLSDSSLSRRHRRDGTMSSGYNTGPTAYTLTQTGNNTVSSSLDSIIDQH